MECKCELARSTFVGARLTFKRGCSAFGGARLTFELGCSAFVRACLTIKRSRSTTKHRCLTFPYYKGGFFNMSLLELLQGTENHILPERYNHLSDKEMEHRIWNLKKKFGEKLFIPGHHYQKDEVIQFADASGDSLQLAQISAANKKAEYVVFCGVHFMAETADILTEDDQKVILPDMRAGCSMADMANITQTERGWGIMQDAFGDTILPLTYVNSTAAIKSFVGKHGGATVTSSNAKKMLEWAFTQKERILFLPDQHLGRNTAYDLGIPLDEM